MVDRTTRIGRVFKTMTSTCPLEIAMYSKCVLRNADSIEKGICSKEFEALRKCFLSSKSKAVRTS